MTIDWIAVEVVLRKSYADATTEELRLLDTAIRSNPDKVRGLRQAAARWHAHQPPPGAVWW